jgi:hypothetical protein
MSAPMDFSGNVTAYRSPDPKDYTYGPVLTVTGARVNSTRVDFVERPLANFIEMSLSGEAGSCPYLLSWDETDHEWISHGKVLHKGLGKDNAYTEMVTFPSLRTHFRIEEREPELAHLQSAALFLELRDGTTQTLSPATRLQVTGYYERYTNLLSEQARSMRATPVPMRANAVALPATAPRPAH